MKSCLRRFWLLKWWTWEAHCFHEIPGSRKEEPDPAHDGLTKHDVHTRKCCKCKLTVTEPVYYGDYC